MTGGLGPALVRRFRSRPSADFLRVSPKEQATSNGPHADADQREDEEHIQQLDSVPDGVEAPTESTEYHGIQDFLLRAIAQWSAVGADDGNRDALERFGALLVAFGAIPDRLGAPRELMRLDTRADLQAAPQRGSVVYPLAVEFPRNSFAAPARPGRRPSRRRAGAAFELRHAGFFGTRCCATLS